MSLEPSFPQNNTPNALKDEASLGNMSATQDFSPPKDSSEHQSQHIRHPLDGLKKAVSETDQTVVSDTSPLSSGEENLQSGDTKQESLVPIPPSGLQLSSGMMLGPFTVTKFIGGGGMGRVYLGFDKSLDRKVALKVLQRQRAQDQSSVARFMNEAKSAARLNHEHIAQVYFAGQQDEIPFIAFEFVEGINIRTIVENHGVFPLPQAITYLIQIAHALDHAASHGVIHRDVKPSNILITKEGRAKLIDMGLARLLKPTDPGDDLTASGVTLGTFDYISPEQARDPRNADIRSDIYSLGCTFFFMLTGRPPFHEGTVLQKLLQHQGDEPPDIRLFLPGAPSEVAHILQKMMAKDPRQRYQTPASLLTELTDIATKLGLRPSKQGKTVWTLRSSTTRQSLVLTHVPWICGVVLFLMTLVFLNWFWPQTAIQLPPIPSNGGGGTSGNGKNPESPDIPLISLEKWPLHYREENDLQTRSQTAKEASPWRTTRYSSGLGVRFVRETFALQTSKEFSGSLGAVFPTKATGSDNNQSTGSTTLIVDPFNFQDQEGIYSNLTAAISAAGKDTIIELRYNGPVEMKIEPMSLTGKQLTIQAAKGFSPILQFKPSDSSVVKEGRIFLFLVNGGNLRFHKIAFEMEVSPLYAEKWFLFDMFGPGQLLLSDCSITIRNTRQGSTDVINEKVSVFRIAQSINSESNMSGLTSSSVIPPLVRPPNIVSRLNPGEVTDSESLPPDQLTTERLPGTIGGRIVNDQERDMDEKSDSSGSQIVLNNCIVRGETTVLSVEAKRPVRLDVNNAFFATDLPFVQLREIPGLFREREQIVNISMEHVSLYCKSRLSRFTKGENSYPLSVKWLVKSSVFRLHKTPVNEFLGFMKPEEIKSEELVTYSEWDGESVFFQDVSSFAEIKASTSVTRPPTLLLDDWKTRWRSPPTINIDVFQTQLPENRVVNRMTPTDMAILQRSPASQAVSKLENDTLTKIDAGLIYELLPK